jgi:DNA-binding NarL/FixJ family response regulator
MSGDEKGTDMATTVAVVEDHPAFRQGICALLASDPDLLVVAEAADLRAARAMARELRPSLMVLDVALPDGDGMSLVKDVSRYAPQTLFFALTMFTGEFFVSRALTAGVSGYATKSQTPIEILNGVRAVARGERYVPPRFAHLLVEPSRPERRKANRREAIAY